MKVRAWLQPLHIRPINKMPGLIDITEPHNMHGVHVPPATQTASPGDLLKSGNKHAEDALRGGDTTAMRFALNTFNYVGVCFFGGDATLPAVERPPYSDQVFGAGQCLMNNIHAVQEVAPSALQATDVDALRAELKQLEEVQKVKADLTPVLEIYARLEDNLLASIYQRMAPVHAQAQSAILNHVTLAQNLGPFSRLFLQGGEDSLESRKNNQKVTEKAVEQTLDKVKKALDDAKKATPPGAPQPPTVDLENLFGRRER